MLHGYEISSKASKFFKAFNEKIKLYEGFEELEKMENYFDYIILSEVIEHMPDTAINKNIDLIHKILKNGGEIIVTAPHENIPVHKKHYRHYNSENLLKNFPSQKFELLEKKFLFKKNIFITILRKIFFNRYFLINSNLLHNLYYKVNKNFFLVMKVTAKIYCLSLKKNENISYGYSGSIGFNDYYNVTLKHL